MVWYSAVILSALSRFSTIDLSYLNQPYIEILLVHSQKFAVCDDVECRDGVSYSFLCCLLQEVDIRRCLFNAIEISW